MLLCELNFISLKTKVSYYSMIAQGIYPSYSTLKSHMQNIKGYIGTFDDLLLYKGDQLHMNNQPERCA
jgi:hypothetical protein